MGNAKIEKLLDEFMREFEKCNPSSKVFNAVMYLDETTSHLHIDIVPMAHKNREQYPYYRDEYSTRRHFQRVKAYQEQLTLVLGNNFAHLEIVLASANGNYRVSSALGTSFKRFLRGTEFDFLTLRTLRHCNATLLLNSSVDLKVVSEHLGNCDIEVTANVYADVLKSSKIKVADLIALKIS